MTTAQTDRIEQILEVGRNQVLAEVSEMLQNLHGSDLTIHELIGMAALLRPSYERQKAEEATVLTLVPRRSRQRSGGAR